LAIARAALREPDLPVATLDGPLREVRLLWITARTLVARAPRCRTGCACRHLHELEPGRDPGPGCLDRFCELDRLTTWLAQCEQMVLARLASELVHDIRAHTVRINALRKELAALVTPLAPRLLALPGCGVLITAKILGDVGQINRFR
jgi:transposase